MISLVKAETRKLVTTRSAYGLLAGMLFLAGPGILLAGETEVPRLSAPLHEQVWFFITSGFTRLLVVVLGIKAVTDEFRYGTIVPTLLATPSRGRLMVAKGITAGMAGFAFTVAAEAVMVGVAVVFIPSRGAEVMITPATVRALVGMAAAGMLWSVIGVGIGSLTRHQIPAVVGSLLWLLPGGGIEELVRESLGRIGDYLPGNQGLALAVSGSTKAWLAGGILGLYAVALLTGGVIVMRSRDVTT